MINWSLQIDVFNISFNDIVWDFLFWLIEHLVQTVWSNVFGDNLIRL